MHYKFIYRLNTKYAANDFLLSFDFRGYQLYCLTSIFLALIYYPSLMLGNFGNVFACVGIYIRSFFSVIVGESSVLISCALINMLFSFNHS